MDAKKDKPLHPTVAKQRQPWAIAEARRQLEESSLKIPGFSYDGKVYQPDSTDAPAKPTPPEKPEAKPKA